MDTVERIVLFGATGGLGSKVIDAALSAGLKVLAIVRRPEALAARAGLTVERADVLDVQSVTAALLKHTDFTAGAVAVSALGSRGPETGSLAGIMGPLARAVADNTRRSRKNWPAQDITR